MKLQGSCVLVTGGAGFIGSGLSRRALASGARVVVADNLATGFRRNVPEGALFEELDVSDPIATRALFERHRFDIVLHLAAQVSNIISHKDPWLDFRTNVGGTINVLDGVVHHRIPRLMYASSMALYGKPAASPVNEDCPLRPLSPYGVSKLAAEHMVHNTAARNDLDFELRVTSMRMFNVYGPGQSLENPYQGVASVFISNVLAGEPITLFGDGLQSRDFVYIDDVLDAWIAAVSEPRTKGLRINVGRGEESSINDLIDAVLNAFGYTRSTYSVLKKPELPGDQRSIRADTTLARDLLRWSARVGLSEGLKATIDWGKKTWNANASSS